MYPPIHSLRQRLYAKSTRCCHLDREGKNSVRHAATVSQQKSVQLRKTLWRGFLLRCILLQFSTLSCWFVFVFKSFYLILFMTEKYAKGPGTGLVSRMKLCSWVLRHHSVASFTAFGELKLHSLQKLKRAWFSLVCINLFIVVFTLKIRERGNSLFTH